MADKIEKETYLPSSVANARLRDSETNIIDKIAKREYYRRINHTPMGFLYDPNLGDYNWTEEQRTNYDDTMAKIEAIIGNKARAEFLNRTVCMYISSGQYTHAERLFEDFKNFYEAAIAEGNNPELEIYFYVKRRKKNLKYLGEADAWGLTEQQEKERERFTFLSEYYKRLGIKIVYENGEFVARDLDYDYNWEDDQNFLEEFIVPKRKRKDGINY